MRSGPRLPVRPVTTELSSIRGRNVRYGSVYAAAAMAVAACAPAVTVVSAPRAESGYASAVSDALLYTEFMPDQGCTGVDIGRGFFVTAQHCVDELELGALVHGGALVYLDPHLDYAVIFDAARLQRNPPCMRSGRLGEHVYAIGYPVQLATDKQELTVTDGVMAGPAGNDGTERFTAPIYFGNSGGGVWAAVDGCLVGISVSGFLQLPGMNFLVSAADIRPFAAVE